MDHLKGNSVTTGQLPKLAGGWEVSKVTPNPWGKVPFTGEGQSLSPTAQRYKDRLLERVASPDSSAKRHHYVPQTHLKRWSPDGKRVWTLDTHTGASKLLGLRHVCVAENFHRVLGPDGSPHNRVELLFGVVDEELRRVEELVVALEDPDELSFDDFMALGVMAALQRMRTLQARRLMHQYDMWLTVQKSPGHDSQKTFPIPALRLSSMHTQAVFEAMWGAADTMTGRQIEFWDDPKGRFVTSDCPVQIPFINNVRPDVLAADRIWWPISPYRAIAWSNDMLGKKVVLRQASRSVIDRVRGAMVQGRERFIIATEQQLSYLPQGKAVGKRAQARFRCSQHHLGEYIKPPQCVVQYTESYGHHPDVSLCNNGLHRAALDLAQLS